MNLYEHPRRLYKYYPLSRDFAVKLFNDGKLLSLMFTPNLQREEAKKIGEVIDKWRLIAIDGYIFYTSPRFFNDPFDTALPNAPEIVPPIKERKEIIEELKRIIPIKKEEMNRLLYSEDFDRALRVVSEKMPVDTRTKELVLNEWKKLRVTYKEEVAISCFSEEKDSHLMWAHYAGGYTGFCIEYDFKQSYDISLQRGIGKVKYTNERPIQNQSNDIGDYRSKVLLTKSKHWSYEKEWRSTKIVEYWAWKNKMYPIIRVKNCIKAIYLGCNMPEKFKKEIAEAYKETDVKVYEMKLSDNRFDFSFEEYIL